MVAGVSCLAMCAVQRGVAQGPGHALGAECEEKRACRRLPGPLPTMSENAASAGRPPPGRSDRLGAGGAWLLWRSGASRRELSPEAGKVGRGLANQLGFSFQVMGYHHRGPSNPGLCFRKAIGHSGEGTVKGGPPRRIVLEVLSGAGGG